MSPPLPSRTAPLAMFSDESFHPADESGPFIRLGVICSEDSLGDVRKQFSKHADDFVYSVKKPNVNEIGGDKIWDVFEEATADTEVKKEPRFGFAESALRYIESVFYPQGPLFVVGAAISAPSGSSTRARQLASTSQLPWDTIHGQRWTLGGRELETVLACEHTLLRFQNLVTSYSKRFGTSYGRVVFDNFANKKNESDDDAKTKAENSMVGSRRRFQNNVIDDRLGNYLRAQRQNAYILSLCFLPSRYEPLLQIADIIAYFWRQKCEGIKTDFAKHIEETAEKIKNDFGFDPLVEIH